MQLAPWLTQDDFTKRIPGGIPESFDADVILGPIVQDVVDDWLNEILGNNRLAALKAYMVEGAGNPQLDELKNEVVSFLIYATWSTYVLANNVTVTTSGLVTKETDSSSPIEDKQRTQLHVHYRGKAERKAVKVAEIVASQQTDTCKPVRTGIQRRIRKAQRKPNSYFQ